MLADTDLDLVVLEGLDFEPEVPCEALRTKQCPNVAEWYSRCRGCGMAPALCTAHVDKYRALGRVRCAACGAMAPSFDELVELIPIKAKS